MPDPYQAEAALALARVLAALDRNTRDRQRARDLGMAALADVRRAGPAFDRLRREVEDWLASEGFAATKPRL